MQSLLWFQPFIYLLKAVGYRDVEVACDEAVVEGRDMEERKEYGYALLECMEQERTEGVLFKKRVVKTGYYIISFPQEFAAGYRDGDLACRVGELDIPVTKQMLEQGYVYLWTDRKPEIYSVNRGLELV